MYIYMCMCMYILFNETFFLNEWYFESFECSTDESSRESVEDSKDSKYHWF